MPSMYLLSAAFVGRSVTLGERVHICWQSSARAETAMASGVRTRADDVLVCVHGRAQVDRVHQCPRSHQQLREAAGAAPGSRTVLPRSAASGIPRYHSSRASERSAPVRLSSWVSGCPFHWSPKTRVFNSEGTGI